MMKLTTKSVCIALVVGAISSRPASPRAQVLVKNVEWVRCSQPFGMKLAFELQLKNRSEKPLQLGSLSVAQERLYRKNEKGQLELIRTSNTPDEFVLPDSSKAETNSSAKIQEQIVPRNESKSLIMNHYVYVMPSDLQFYRGRWNLIASFHITNVQRDGGMSDYWTDPVTIALAPWPPRCL